MNKIYNNLNIENLTKTEWFNQFDIYQQEEIYEGLEENLDVSIYAKKELNWQQMEEIKLGLMDNLDVSFYSDKDFNCLQMHQIRLGLTENIDVSKYAKKEFNMYQYMLNLN